MRPSRELGTAPCAVLKRQVGRDFKRQVAGLGAALALFLLMQGFERGHNLQERCW